MENQFLDSNLEQPTKNAAYATFGERLVAVIIDGLLMSVIAVIIFFATGSFGKLMELMQDTDNSNDPFALLQVLGLSLVLIIVLNWLYSAYFESSEKQATLGKQAMSIYVTDANGERLTFGRATGRFFARFVLGLVPSLGTLLQLVDGLTMLFTKDKQTLHDMMAGTYVYKK